MGGHRHPKLKKPIEPGLFLDEFDDVWVRVFPNDRFPPILFTKALAITHTVCARRYAEVDLRRRIFHFAPQVLWLPKPHRLGLIAHEIGHLLTYYAKGFQHTEDEADASAERLLGIKITYDHRWPGKGLQRGRWSE